MFRTITLNATHPEIRSTGDEFRLLMPLDAGRHYRWLTGPAASFERAPVITIHDRLYPVASWAREETGIRITDPAWPAILDAGPMDLDLLQDCDGSRTLDDLLQSLSIPEHNRAVAVGAAQSLVDRGVLCPLERLRIEVNMSGRSGAALRDETGH